MNALQSQDFIHCLGNLAVIGASSAAAWGVSFSVNELAKRIFKERKPSCAAAATILGVLSAVLISRRLPLTPFTGAQVGNFFVIDLCTFIAARYLKTHTHLMPFTIASGTGFLQKWVFKDLLFIPGTYAAIFGVYLSDRLFPINPANGPARA